MIDIKDFKIDDCYGVEFLHLTFSVTDMTEPPERYKINLERSMNQSGPYVLIAEDLPNFRFTDYNVNLLNPNLRYYYRLTITDMQTGSSTMEMKAHHVTMPDRYALAIEEIEKRYIEDVIGNRTAYLLQKKRTGARCSCWNPNRDATNDEHCEICFGTGYAGGYYDPCAVKIAKETIFSQQHAFSAMEDADTSGMQQVWIRSFPKVENEDVLVDGSDRFVVTHHSDLMKNGHLIRQLCTIAPLPRSNIAYRIPISEKSR